MHRRGIFCRKTVRFQAPGRRRALRAHWKFHVRLRLAVPIGLALIEIRESFRSCSRISERLIPAVGAGARAFVKKKNRRLPSEKRRFNLKTFPKTPFDSKSRTKTQQLGYCPAFSSPIFFSPGSSTAMLSTCPAWGNMFITPAARTRQPPSWCRIAQSRASVAGLHET